MRYTANTDRRISERVGNRVTHHRRGRVNWPVSVFKGCGRVPTELFNTPFSFEVRIILIDANFSFILGLVIYYWTLVTATDLKNVSK